MCVVCWLVALFFACWLLSSLCVLLCVVFFCEIVGCWLLCVCCSLLIVRCSLIGVLCSFDLLCVVVGCLLVVDC